jgi:16S rRNA (guanine1516-N2)-methyltransferase
MTHLAVFTEDPHLLAEADLLAKRLALPFTRESDYLLLLTPDYLGLIQTDNKSLPLYVDFLSGKMTYRRQHATLKNETIARALGLKSKMQFKIIDATAGLARDSFILASLGFEVTLLERSPIIHALLEDGIRRASFDPVTAQVIKRLQLIQADAINWLKQAERPDIIYLDPMFPERQKSALVKKEMRIFQDIISEEDDTALLLTTALSCAKKRVVVKRPRLAEAIKGPSPSFSLKGSSSRFDIYLIRETF